MVEQEVKERKKKRKRSGFWRYFFLTFKEGKYILYKYLVTAVLFSIVTILSNLLGVQELTYLNAFLAINAFSSLISFGISSGINVLLNQNIGSKYKVRKFAKIGFELNLIVAGIFLIVLVAFPRFIMETITGFVPDSYEFYYVMCFYFLLCSMAYYFQATLRELKIFKAGFYCEILPILVTIVGMLVLYLTGGMHLMAIAIVYLCSGFVSAGMGYYNLLKNHIIAIDFKQVEPIRLSRKQYGIIFSNLAIEFLWQVGCFVTSVLLLRVSDAFFNTYSYLETVLDIFNGVLFAFLCITCIRITRSLGRNQFSKAYMHAKYSIIACIVIWAFYMIASLILIYPIALGVNDAYFDVMFVAVPCYVFIHLFRFLSWNFSSYMLRLGGKSRAMLVMEIFGLIMNIVLLLIIDFIPSNMFLIYFLIALPDIITLPIDFIIFKRKKWMANINEDPNMLKNKVKCIIFDFDDTLYYDVDWSFWQKICENFFEEHFSYLSKEKRKELRKKYEKMGSLSDTLGRMCYELEGSADPWLKYRDSLPMQPEEREGKAVSMKELGKCKEQGNLYIVSNSRLVDIKRTSKFYGIDLDIFKKVFTNEYTEQVGTKEDIYLKIMQEEGLSADEILVVGNNYKSDLKPAKNLKMNYCKVKDGFTFEEIMG